MASSSSSKKNGEVMGKYSDIDEYGFMRSKDFDYKSYENFFSEYTAVLARRAARWNKLLNNGKKTKVKGDRTVLVTGIQHHSLNKDGKLRTTLWSVKRFCRKGIPMQYRRMVWMGVSGAQKRLDKNPGVYEEMLSDDYETSPKDIELIESIRTDIDRTFPDNINFRDGARTGEKRLCLERVLKALGRFKKDVGYCQGMNYIAALLLLVVEDEESVFWLFVSLLEDILPEYYSKSMIGLRTEMEVLDALVKDRIPVVASTLEREEVNWVLLSSKWFICLYVDVLPTETVLRIWDCLFMEGSKILFRVALLLIRLRTDRVKSATDMPEVIEAFKDVKKEEAVLECHSFMQACFVEKVPLRMAEIKKLRQINEEKLNKEDSKRKPRR